MAKLIKFVCVEALEEDGHAKYLVSENGHFIGVTPNPEQPERVKLEHWSRDQPPTVSLCERFLPRRHVRKMSRDITKALKKKMLKCHLPKGAKKNAPIWALAADYAGAMEAFGVKEPKKPTKAEIAADKKKHAAERAAPSPSSDGNK